jgi:three-Cys-motif partner protein
VTPGSLVFCFVDPYKVDNLRFGTLANLASVHRVDFLVLIPTGMDVNRNPATYSQPPDTRIADFVGSADWRTRWNPRNPHVNFGDFVANEFGLSMKAIGYRYDGLASTKTIVNDKNAPLYRLAFFSRHPLGAKFWDECKKYTNPQRALF